MCIDSGCMICTVHLSMTIFQTILFGFYCLLYMWRSGLLALQRSSANRSDTIRINTARNGAKIQLEYS